MTFRPHPKQAEFMREPPNRIVMTGLGRPSAPGPCRLVGLLEWCKQQETCQRPIEFIRQAPEGATGLAGVDMRGVRPCGGRLIDGKCELCDVTTIEGGEGR